MTIPGRLAEPMLHGKLRRWLRGQIGNSHGQSLRRTRGSRNWRVFVNVQWEVPSLLFAMPQRRKASKPSLAGVGPARKEWGGGVLTPRECEVVRLVAEGCSSKEVAQRLGISVATVGTHRSNLMRKLSLHSVTELVRYAVRNKLVKV